VEAERGVFAFTPLVRGIGGFSLSSFLHKQESRKNFPVLLQHKKIILSKAEKPLDNKHSVC
jgi:hypothetical protein